MRGVGEKTANQAIALPDELVYAILSHLEPLQVVRVERVCKQWSQVAHNASSLYRDALFLEEDICIDAKRNRARIDGLVRRSQGHLRSLATIADPDVDGLSDVQHLCDILSSTHLEDLWIQSCHNRVFRKRDGSHNVPPVSDIIMKNYGADRTHIRAKIDEAIQMILTSVLRCSNLRGLQIDVTGNISLPARLCDYPIHICKLERISMIGVRWGTIFEDDDCFFDMIKHAKVIELYNGIQGIHERHLWRIMLQGCHTIEYLNINVDGLRYHEREEGTIKLSEMRHISLEFSNVSDAYGHASDNVPDIAQFRLLCPKLRSVKLHFDVPGTIFHDLLTDTIEDLEVSLEENSIKNLSEALHSCQALRKVRLHVFESGNAVAVIKCLAGPECLPMPLEELVVLQERLATNLGEALVDLVKAQKQIKSITLVGCMPLHPRSSDWLYANVEHFRMISYEEMKDPRFKILYDVQHFSDGDCLLERRSRLYSSL